MVDAIANRNKRPKLVRRPRGSPSTVPLFPEAYSWKEEKRVYKALAKLYRDKSCALWEDLIARRGDRRYCITAASIQTQNPEIFSVGDVCDWLAYTQLRDVIDRHMPPDPAMNGPPLTLELGIKDLAQWRKQRKEKSLYQLQIELCETAIRELAKVRGIPKREKVLARRKIRAAIQKLTRTKKPIFMKDTSVGFSNHVPVFSPGLAKVIRKAIQSGSAKDIIIIH
jgi:hypothetical protein